MSSIYVNNILPTGEIEVTVSGSLKVTGSFQTTGAIQANNTLTVGKNDTGHDVKFFGATSGQYMLWDESADELVLAGDSKLSFHDAAGGENIVASADGHLEVNAGTTLDMTAPTIDVNGTTEVQIDTPTFDVNGTTAVTIDCTNTSNGITIGTSTSGVPISIGHTTSETTVNDNLTVTGDLTVNGTTTSVNSTTINITSSFIFEGVADSHETTLHAGGDGTGATPSADTTIYLPAMSAGSYYLPVLAAASTTSITSTPGELNLLDGCSAGTVVNSKAVIYSSDGDIAVGDNLTLTSDSSVISLGADADATLTHDGTTGLTIAATPISIDSTGELHLNSTTGDIKLQDGGTDQIAFDLDGTAGEVIMKPAVDSDDFVIAQYDGTEVIRIEDNGDFDVAGGAGSSGVTITSAGVLTADGRIITDDTTEATSTTDGSLQTDGGLSVAKSAVIGDDLDLLSDGAILNIGSTSKFTLTDQASNNCVMAASGARLAFGNAGEYISGDGTDLKIVSSNDIDVTGDMNVAGEVTSTKLTTLASAEGVTTIGSTTAATFSAAGLLNINNATEATSTTDGSLQTDGGLSVAKSAVIGDDLDLLSDGAIISFGADKEITLTHEADVGLILEGNGQSADPTLTIKNTNADATGGSLKFLKDGSSVADADVIGNITFVSEDDGSNAHTYASIIGSISDMTAGAEGGKLQFNVAEHDGTVTQGLLLADGDADGEIDVTIGAGADSLTTIAGDLDIPNGGFALGSDASGDMYYRNASGVLARIAVGSDNHVLTLNGAVPGWEAASSGGAVSAVANGSDNRIATFSSSDALNGEANLTFDGTDLAATLDTATFTSANSTDPLIVIKNTTNDANGARLRFVKDKGAAGAANDDVGLIEFYGDDANQDQVLFGRIRTRVAVHTNGQEGGKMHLSVASHDGELNHGLIIGDGDAEDEVDVTIGNGSASLTTVAGQLSGAAGISGLTGTFEEGLSVGNATVISADKAIANVTTVSGSGAVSGLTGTFEEGLSVGNSTVISADKNIANVGTITSTGIVKVGASAGSGADAFLYTAGTAAHVGIQWDADGNTEGTLIGGADDHGVDFIFYGESTGKYVQWDMSGDELVLASSAKLSFHDAAGGENIVASSNGHLEINSGTTLDITAPTVDINASTAVTIDGPSVIVASSTSQKPLVEIKNTTNDANGAVLRFVKDKGAAGAANDVAGMIEFYADDAAQDQVLFGRIATQVSVHTNGQEGGLLALQVASHDGEINNGLIIVDGSAEDEIDVTIGNGSESLTTVAGDLSVTGADIVIGADGDGTDRTVTFGHSTLKTIMGIDDSADTFILNTDSAFDATVANNSLSIDANHKMIVGGSLRAKGYIVPHYVQYNTTADSEKALPMYIVSEAASPGSTDSVHVIVAPFDGVLKRALVRTSGAQNGNVDLRIYKIADGTGADGFADTDEVEFVRVSMGNADTTSVFNTSGSSHFSAGEAVSVSLDMNSNPGDVNVSLIWEYNTSAL
jgi:hypothetical protein